MKGKINFSHSLGLFLKNLKIFRARAPATPQLRALVFGAFLFFARCAPAFRAKFQIFVFFLKRAPTKIFGYPTRKFAEQISRDFARNLQNLQKFCKNLQNLHPDRFSNFCKIFAFGKNFANSRRAKAEISADFYQKSAEISAKFVQILTKN